MTVSKLDPCLFVGDKVLCISYDDDILFWNYWTWNQTLCLRSAIGPRGWRYRFLESLSNQELCWPDWDESNRSDWLCDWDSWPWLPHVYSKMDTCWRHSLGFWSGWWTATWKFQLHLCPWNAPLSLWEYSIGHCRCHELLRNIHVQPSLLSWDCA